MAIRKKLGPVSAYALAVKGGYTGTEAEWVKAQADAAKNGELAKTSADKAAISETNAKLDADRSEKWAKSIKNTESDSASALFSSAKGSVLTLENTARKPLRSMKIYGKTTQDGVPTPDAPVPLVSAGDGGKIITEITGENFFPGSNTNWGGDDYVSLEYVANKLIVHRGGDGSIYLGRNTEILLPAGQYLIKADDITKTPRSAIIEISDQNQTITALTSTVSGFQNSFVIEKNKLVTIRVYQGENTSEDSIFTGLRIIRAGTEDKWSSWSKLQLLPLSTPNGLPGAKVEVGGNYTDGNGQEWFCDYIDLDRGKYVKNFVFETFDGSPDEGWDWNSTIGTERRISIPIKEISTVWPDKKLGPIMSDCYKGMSSSQNYLKNESVALNFNVGRFFIYDPNFTTEDITLWRNHLTRKPLTVMYPLKVPVETDLTPEEIAAYKALRTNYPTTTIFNDSIAEQEVEYVVDTKTYIDNGDKVGSDALDQAMTNKTNIDNNKSNIEKNKNDISSLSGTVNKALPTDKSLTVKDKAADAEVTGFHIDNLYKSNFDSIETSSSVVTCEPLEGSPLHVVSEIVPQQAGSGDPSPTNVRPITGWTGAKLAQRGANLADPSNAFKSYAGLKIDVDESGEYHVYGTPNQNYAVISRWRPYFLFGRPVTGFFTLALDRPLDIAVWWRFAAKADIDISPGKTFKTQLVEQVCSTETMFSLKNLEIGTPIDLRFRLSLSLTQDPNYRSYVAGTDYTADFGQTVYGGSYDWQSGKLNPFDTIEKIPLDDWTTSSTTQQGTRMVTKSKLADLGEDSGLSKIFCDQYKSVTTEQTYYKTTGISIGLNGRIEVYDPDFQTLQGWKDHISALSAAGTPLQIVFKPINEESVQLLPQPIPALPGVNTLYTDTGDTSATYYADPKTSLNSVKQLASNAFDIANKNKQEVDKALPTDTSFKQIGKAADAKLTGDTLLELMRMIVIDNIDVAPKKNIQRIVRTGFAPDIFPVGSTIKVNHTKYGEQDFVVLGHDVHVNSENPYGHTMTLGSVPILENIQFDEVEALYAADQELPAGTYNFTTEGYDKWVKGTYSFTLSKSLPVGGQICISGQYPYQGNLTLAKVSTYPSNTSTTAIETGIAITEGASGTSLGSTGIELNHIHKVGYGSNNYAESAIRQFMNSDQDKNTFWAPKTKYDRPPYWRSSHDGFLKGLDSDFKNILCVPKVLCSTNNTWEDPNSQYNKNTAYELNDKIFLLSNREVGFEYDVDDGTSVLPYYKGKADADRVKYNTSGSVSHWWLRTPVQWNSSHVRSVHTSGAVHNHGASTSLGFAPACVIG